MGVGEAENGVEVLVPFHGIGGRGEGLASELLVRSTEREDSGTARALEIDGELQRIVVGIIG